MANLKTIGGSIVNTAGAPLPSKTVTLKNDDTGASITTTTTNADGEWEFANRDETLRYRAEAAFGGSSSQVVVRKPASAEFDHLYANLSFRSAAGATVAFAGPITGTNLTLSGTLTALNVAGSHVAAGDLDVSGTATIPTANIASLYATGFTDISGTLEVNAPTIINNSVEIVGAGLDVSGQITTQDNLNCFGVVNAELGLVIGGGAVNWDNSGNMHHYSGTASFEGTSLTTGPSTGLGFYGTAGQTKPTVTGSRGGNAALTSLLTALANLGLVTNSSS